MNTQDRIRNLQQRRRHLLARRECRGAPIAALDLELTVVRSELLALYASQRANHAATAVVQAS
ncbi:hypothetical protein HF288_11960 [Acidithiobacillus caldus]|uniref:hypothetical protein n=1 Tax=Acidithiobacillus caldus TaxID=33059 RepID=UPI001C06DC90|nr:hypothetical protein [Acidithiobacillus caldus]MBU2791097.1 hypothetical protein [Acidithiobacillus caldus]MBU2822024.1 hypothetical protein [Acidithiobacillus caldus]